MKLLQNKWTEETIAEEINCDLKWVWRKHQYFVLLNLMWEKAPLHAPFFPPSTVVDSVPIKNIEAILSEAMTNRTWTFPNLTLAEWKVLGKRPVRNRN